VWGEGQGSVLSYQGPKRFSTVGPVVSASLFLLQVFKSISDAFFFFFSGILEFILFDLACLDFDPMLIEKKKEKYQ
jgi:hypothetical protein